MATHPFSQSSKQALVPQTSSKISAALSKKPQAYQFTPKPKLKVQNQKSNENTDDDLDTYMLQSYINGATNKMSGPQQEAKKSNNNALTNITNNQKSNGSLKGILKNTYTKMPTTYTTTANTSTSATGNFSAKKNNPSNNRKSTKNKNDLTATVAQFANKKEELTNLKFFSGTARSIVHFSTLFEEANMQHNKYGNKNINLPPPMWAHLFEIIGMLFI